MSRAVTRTIRITVKATDDEYFRLETDSNLIHNWLGGKESESRLAIYEAGLETMLKRMAEKTNAANKEAVTRAAIRKKTREIRDRDESWKALESIFESMTSDEFSVWCRENDVDVTGFLEWREAKQNDSFGGELQHWLSDVLHDGDPVPTSSIRQKAISDGMIEDTPQDWTYLRVVALRSGYVGKQHGFWQNGIGQSTKKSKNDDEPSF